MNMKLLTSVPLCLGTLVAGGLASAQNLNPAPVNRRGAFSAMSMGLVLDGPSAPDHRLRIKRAGDQNNPLTFPQVMGLSGSTGGPSDAIDYGALQLQDGALKGVEIDAVSSGNTVLPGHLDGVVTLVDSWYVLSVSASQDTHGTASSHFKRGQSQGRGAGGEIVSYCFSGSTGFAGIMPGSTHLEMKRTHLGLSRLSKDDVIAFDYGMASTFETGDESDLFEESQHLYFSVTVEWAQAHQAPFATLNPGGSPDRNPHAADVYRVSWDHANDTWSTPEVIFTWQELGFYASGNLDAMDVNEAGTRIVYSPSWTSEPGVGQTLLDGTMVINGEQSQLMIYDAVGNLVGAANGIGPAALKDTDDEKVASKMGIRDLVEDDEIDGSCGMDPEQMGVVTTDHSLPYLSSYVDSEPMGLAAARGNRSIDFQPGKDNRDNEYLSINVTGWGDRSERQGTVRLFVTSLTSGLNPNSMDYSQWTLRETRRRLPQDESMTFTFGPLLTVDRTPAPSGRYTFYAELLNDQGQVILGSVMGTMRL